ncbi:ATP-binding protein [Streptomyces sp. H10-C2]|uniref:ATP-binding protein n=1 Tax=unclassified Streptomyces TaxID=2593676 RepID=UPI0024BA720F|nr:MULTISPECIES: ATP-binding protein [unclassified Streptomyces]MDJ0341520.1 ATP-binding protein [Streptomyces sp. PH10-H1]MDJ0369177.1 ATP-binding protein [Streptomyces sp. H10-C2]
MDPHSGRPDDLAAPEPDPGAAGDTVALARLPRQPRDPSPGFGGETLWPEPGTGGSSAARVVQVVAGDFLLTVNPVDGSEVAECPPEERRTPVRRTPQDRERQAVARRPQLPPGPRATELPLLERDEERERLIRLLARGRSVRVTGPSGAGRSSLLDVVAAACADLAPDGVLRLSGYRRTTSDLLQDLFSLVYEADGYRPDRPRLLELLSDVGAVVVLDDLEFGGAALEELLAAAPECAFLITTTPDVAAPASDSLIEEVFLPGLTRVACLELLERVVERPLDEEEAAWAADLWFESEGLPLRFFQAGALLRQRDVLRTPVEAGTEWDDSVWTSDVSSGGPFDAEPAGRIPLPSLAESAAPADLLASRLSEAAQTALVFAVALDGDCPHPSHLPALVGDTHGDAALGEIAACGLAVPVASHYRLAAGVRQQLAVGLAAEPDDTAARSLAAAQHYAWWADHPSVAPQRTASEAEAILAAMAACRDAGHPNSAVLLARTAAPAFAAALHWSAWERALRIGQESARLAGEVAEEAYFHHELGVLALCTGNLDRARAELEASIGLRGALADRQGTLVGRRTLALVNDRSSSPPSVAGVEIPTPGSDASLLPAALLAGSGTAYEPPVTVISKRLAAAGPSPRRAAFGNPRRNLLAAGAGAVLAAVVGTIVTLGTSAGSSDNRNVPNNVKPVESAQPDDPNAGLPADQPTTGATKPGQTTPPATPTSPGGQPATSGRPGGSSSAPGSDNHTSPAPGRTSSAPSTSGSPSNSPKPSSPGTPSGTPSGTQSSTPSASGSSSASPSPSPSR